LKIIIIEIYNSELHKGKKILIGVTGGIGAGKTLACRFFKEAGLNVFYADDIAKKLYNTNKILKSKMIDEFGNDILEKNKISFQKLRELVFANKKNQQRVNRIIHPFVIAEILNLAGNSRSKIILIEAALIFESSFDKYLDYVINVSENQKKRIERVRKRNAMSIKIIKSIMNIQMNEKERNRRADFVIKNEGSVKDFNKKVKFLAKLILLLPFKIKI